MLKYISVYTSAVPDISREKAEYCRNGETERYPTRKQGTKHTRFRGPEHNKSQPWRARSAARAQAIDQWLSCSAALDQVTGIRNSVNVRYVRKPLLVSGSSIQYHTLNVTIFQFDLVLLLLRTCKRDV